MLIFTLGHSTRGIDEFTTLLRAHGIRQLIDVRTVPWRCHRSMIADALTVRGVSVRHIMSPTNARVHTLNPMAKVRGTRVIYPSAERPRQNSRRREF